MFGYDPLKPTIITVLLLIFLLVILRRIHKILDNFRLIPHDKDRMVASPQAGAFQEWFVFRAFGVPRRQPQLCQLA